MTWASGDTALAPAAQYVRMSTERQEYSATLQSAANHAFAREHGYRIVRTYADEGVSGLRLDGRDGLKALLADVLGGPPPFAAIIVYDISRWGRFQNPDQAAHYEFLCNEAGVQVQYAAEPFVNDGSLSATLLKHIKRAMAAEYSRELSEKVSRAQRGLAAQGYWQGGPCGYGLRRRVLTRDGQPGPMLEAGEHKGGRDSRTVLAPGPPGEVEVVRRLFRLCLEGHSPEALAEQLNAGPHGTRWSAWRVRELLSNPKYAGDLVVGRTCSVMGRRGRAGPGRVMVATGACEPLVDRATFDAAQVALRRRKPKADDATLLAELRAVLDEHGTLSRRLIEQTPEAHCPDVFRRRFGSLLRAFELVGHAPTARQRQSAERGRRRPPPQRAAKRGLSDEEMLERLRALLRRRGTLNGDIIRAAGDMPSVADYRSRFGLRRAYDLVGYSPTAAQERAFERAARRAIDAVQRAARGASAP